jgi:hypothetical protein
MSGAPDHGPVRRRREADRTARQRPPAAAAIPANQSYRIIEEERRTAVSMGGFMAKFHSRPSAQYRYEHYDPEPEA